MSTLFTNTFPAAVALAVFVAGILVALLALLFRQTQLRARAEHLAAKSQERLALISSMNSFGFWSWDAATDEVWASKQSRTILAITPEAPLSRELLLAAIHPEDRPRVLQSIKSMSCPNTIQTDASTVELELRVARPRGEIRWITIKASSYCDPKGTVNRVAGYVFDDSERKRSAADLLKLQHKLTHVTRVALLGELSGALAHELQQPLTAILCNAHTAQLLTESATVNLPELREVLQEIVNDDKNAGQIIQRLRALLMRGETQFEHLAIRNLLGDVLALARGTLRERNVQVSTRIAEGIPDVQGDRVELQQVLLNLVLNACDSMIANPARDRRMEIVVDLDPGSGAVLFSVLDCGRGIDADQLERVFDPFYTTKTGGLGLGLAISHSIIEAHAGRLWAANRSDRGAAFHFTLPVSLGKKSHEQHNEISVYS